MIAVTGANGLLGSFIVRKLIEQRLPFVALKRKGSDTCLLADVHDKVNWVDADVLDLAALEEAFKDVSKVIHTAAVVSFNPGDKKKIFQVNVAGTRNVVNTCLALGVNKLIHISSVAALGRLKGQENITENSKWIDNPLNSTYAESKYLSELEVFRASEEGLDVSVLNPSVILAPADWQKSSAKLFKYVWDENRFYIENDLNYVDVRDVAEVTVRMLNEKLSGERFTLNAGRLSIKEFFSKIALRFNKRAPSIRANKTALKILAFLEKIRTQITRTEPLITSETARLANTSFYYSNEKITQKLDFKFKSIEETLDWCCKYYIQQPPAKK
jgi:dihydroflavonol-4-reductase